MPGRNQPRSSRGRSAIARRVINTNSTNGLGIHEGGGMKKAGAHPSATGFMRSKPWQISVPARKQMRFKMKIPNNNTDNNNTDNNNTNDDTNNDTHGENHIHVTIHQNQHGKNVYVIDGSPQKTLTLHLGKTYTFTYPANHPLYFSETSDGSHSYGVEHSVGIVRKNNTLTFTVSESTPNTLYYYCGLHSGMGGKINIIKPLADVTCQDTIPCTFQGASGCVIPKTNYCCRIDKWVDGSGCTDGSTDSVCHITTDKNQLAGDTCLEGRDFRDCSSSAPYVPDFPATCPSSVVPQCPQGQSYQIIWKDGKPHCTCDNQSGAPSCVGPPDVVSDVSYQSASIIRLPNGDISLCPQLAPCAGLHVYEKDMDELAEMIASGTQKQQDRAIDILNAVAERYIKQTVDSSACPSYYFYNLSVDPPILESSKGLWWDCSLALQHGWSDACKSRSSGSFNNGIREDITSNNGCGWWGRGVIQSTGPCNFGKLNNALQKPGSKYYRKFNLCATPDLICNTHKWKELKWIAGFVYWMEDVQYGGKYFNKKPYDFDASINQIASDAANNYRNPNAIIKPFIDATSGLVNRGCAGLMCDAGPVHAADNRLRNASNVYISLMTEYNTSSSKPKNIVDFFDNASPQLQSDFSTIVLHTLAGGIPQPYTFDSFKIALKLVVDQGIAGFKFYTKNLDGATDMNVSILNIAAFLGQCMQETIQYGACDENNWSSMRALPCDGDPKTCGDKHDAYPSVVDIANGMCKCNIPYSHPDTGKVDCSGATPQLKTKEECDVSGICKWDFDNSMCTQDIYGNGGEPDSHGNILNYNFYPSTSSCGQLGQNYKKYSCGNGGINDCSLDIVNKRTMVAKTQAQYYGAAAPMYSLKKDSEESIKFWYCSKDADGGSCANAKPNPY